MQQGYRLTASTGIHKGDRDYQQDQLVLLQHPRSKGCLLAVVADGMGGRTGGRKASDQVIMTARQVFERYDPNTDDGQALLRQITAEAHMSIKLTALSADEEPHSTLAAFVLNPDGECFWAHSGDSRLYHFRGSELVHRTLDHSYVQSLIDKGELTEAQANGHPKSNMLVGCLGTDNDPPMGSHAIHQLLAGDALLACSDGIWHYFTPQELGSALARLSAREASEYLIDLARRRAMGGGDNLSLIIIKLEPLEA